MKLELKVLNDHPYETRKCLGRLLEKGDDENTAAHECPVSGVWFVSDAKAKVVVV